MKRSIKVLCFIMTFALLFGIPGISMVKAEAAELITVEFTTDDPYPNEPAPKTIVVKPDGGTYSHDNIRVEVTTYPENYLADPNQVVSIVWYVSDTDDFSKAKRFNSTNSDPYFRIGKYYFVSLTNLPNLTISGGGINSGNSLWEINGNRFRTNMIDSYGNPHIVASFGFLEYPDKAFRDVSKTDGYYVPIMWAYSHGIAKGTDYSYFSPSDGCTRGQLATMLYKLAGSPNVTLPSKSPFSDVKTSDGYYKAIIWAKQKGIISGYSDGTFKPKATCTRGQTATMLYKMAGSPNVTLPSKSPFSDVKTSDGYYKAIVWAKQKGIVNGYSNGTFRPKNTCTRGQIMTMIYKFNKIYEYVDPEIYVEPRS